MVLGLAEDRPGSNAAIRRVIDRGWFVLGPEVEAFEAEFAAACGAAHAVGVNTGTDALMLALRGLDIGPGDEVITRAAHGGLHRAGHPHGRGHAGVRRHRPGALHHRPRSAVEAAITPRTRAIMPVHLYGQAADMTAIEAIAAAPRAGHRRGLRAGAPGDLCAAGRSAPSASPARSASIRPRTSARSATAAPSSPTTPRSPARLRRLRNGGQTEPLPPRRSPA